MSTVEVFLFLHTIEHGLATFTVGKTLGMKKRLPIHEIEITADPITPCRVLVKMPIWLAGPHGLMPATLRKTSTDGEVGTTSDSVAKDLTDSIVREFGIQAPDRLQTALDAERARSNEVRSPTRRFRPAADAPGNAAGGILESHRARSTVEQIQAGFSDTGEE